MNWNWALEIEKVEPRLKLQSTLVEMSISATTKNRDLIFITELVYSLYIFDI